MANLPDPKWLEFLKASAWQTFAVALSCFVVLVGSRAGWLPVLPSWVLLTLAFVAVLSVTLALGGWLRALFKFLPLHIWAVTYWNRYQHARSVERYIPQMTPKEKEIIGYLLAHNQRTFIGAADGGHAMPLISQTVVVRALQPGQVFDMLSTPFAIHEHVWKVLEKHRAVFPYEEPKRGERRAHPWREAMF